MTTDQTTTTLRHAAAHLRKIGNRIDHEPWHVHDDGLTIMDNKTPVATANTPEDATLIATLAPVAMLLADLLDAEAATRAQMEPFASLISLTIETKTGTVGALKFGVDDNGQPRMIADTWPACERLAGAILRNEP